MPKIIDLTGQRFGRLLVVKRAESTPGGQATWLCRCDCGNETSVAGYSLRCGKTKSCGCLHRDVLDNARTKHGKEGTRLYVVWRGIKQRCYNPSHKSYQYYGGRGITICDGWRDNFQVFYEWAVANGYDENAPMGQCTIDRIDNDNGYSPDNCRWVDHKTQCNNRSHSGPLPKRKKIKSKTQEATK